MITTKATFQRQSLAIQPLVIRREQMTRIANYGISLIRARVAQGIGSDDTPMPPLQVKVSRSGKRYGYAVIKQRRGLGTMRNLYGLGTDGHMLDGIRVTYADDQRANIDITTRAGRTKALANERRAPWYSWSPSDIEKLSVFSRSVITGGSRLGRSTFALPEVA